MCSVSSECGEILVAGYSQIKTASSRSESALRILHALTRLAETGEGDVKALTAQWQGYSRLRVGDYRVIFRATPAEILVVRVRHRSEAYRQN